MLLPVQMPYPFRRGQRPRISHPQDFEAIADYDPNYIVESHPEVRIIALHQKLHSLIILKMYR